MNTKKDKELPSKYEATFEKVMMWNYQCRLGKNISNAFLLAKPWGCLVTIKKVDHKVLCYYLACIKTPLSLKFHNIYLKELSAKTSTSTFKHSFVYICDSLMKKTWTHSQYVFFFSLPCKNPAPFPSQKGQHPCCGFQRYILFWRKQY